VQPSDDEIEPLDEHGFHDATTSSGWTGSGWQTRILHCKAKPP
jgi:hypothetical protein